MISVSELRSGTSFKLDGKMYVVIKYEHVKMGRGTGTVKVKARDLDSGAIIEKSFITGAKVEPVELHNRECSFLYKSGDEYLFMDQYTYEQYELPGKLLGDQAKYLQEGVVARILFTVDDRAVAIDLPPKITLEVVEADPGIKGDSAANMLKSIKVINGLIVRAPLFINVGDKIVVDTRNGEYVERSK